MRLAIYDLRFTICDLRFAVYEMGLKSMVVPRERVSHTSRRDDTFSVVPPGHCFAPEGASEPPRTRRSYRAFHSRILDTYFMSEEQIRYQLVSNTKYEDFVVMEGIQIFLYK